MRVNLWGTRGSVPTPGAAFSEYGGNTPCVEIETGSGTRIILDGGMGLYWLGQSLLDQTFASGGQPVYIFLTHTHWDHIQGIPFFGPMQIARNHFTICGCGSNGKGLEDLLRAQMDYTYCPVPNFFDGPVGAQVDIVELDGSTIELGGARVVGLPVNHDPQVSCLGYRVESEGAVVAYVPDVEYLNEEQRSPALALADKADLLLHGAYYSDADYAAHRGRGHACAADAWAIAQQAGVRRLALFHHHPDHRDEDIAAIVNAYQQREIPVDGAREGHTYHLGNKD